MLFINEPKFEKVSFDQFKKDCIKLYGDVVFNDITLQKIYDTIKLPERSTSYSAGYDFSTPFGFIMNRGENIVVPTGIRCKMPYNTYLALHPRSGMGFKKRLMLANTTGIIDADYYNADNEGHIMAKICYEGINNSCKLLNNNSEELIFETNNVGIYNNDKLVVNAGDRFIQGIFNLYYTVIDDKANGVRTGGEGSTGK